MVYLNVVLNTPRSSRPVVFCKKIDSEKFRTPSYRTPPVATSVHPANINVFKTDNKNTRKRCEIFSKLITKKTRIDVVLNFHQVPKTT